MTRQLDPNFNLFDDWILRLKKGRKINAFNNLHVSFVPLNSLIKTLGFATKNQWNGIIHLSGSENMSYHEIANIMVNKLNINKDLIISSTGVSDVLGFFNVKTTLKYQN